MSWKGLLIPVVSIATFMGCVAFSYLIQISVKSFRKKIVFSLLLIQISIVSLLYLIPQFVFVVLFLLDMWNVSPDVESLGAGFSKYLPRLSLLILPFFLQVEMYISVRKQRLHSKINNIRCGFLLTAVLTVGLALATYVLVLSRMLKTYFFPSDRHPMVTPIMELIIATIGLCIYFAFSRSSGNAYVTGAMAKKRVCVNIVSRYCALIYIAFILVGILRITSTVGHIALMSIGCDIVECITLLADICLISVAPLILLRKSKAFKELTSLIENSRVVPKVSIVNSEPPIQGTLLSRDQDKGGIKVMTLERKKSVIQKMSETYPPKQRFVKVKKTKDRVQRFSLASSADSFTMLPELKNIRKISSSSIFDSDPSKASIFSMPQILPQYKDIPDFQVVVEEKETEDENVRPLFKSVLIPGTVCSSVPSPPKAIQVKSFDSADWSMTPNDVFGQTMPLSTRSIFPSITNTCWRFSQETRSSQTNSDRIFTPQESCWRFSQETRSSQTNSNSIFTPQASSEPRLLDVAPELRMDYIHEALGHRKSAGVAGHLPGFIPSPLPLSPRHRSLNETESVFIRDNPCYSVQENTIIAMLFDI